jgi:hypothetical protein
MNAIDEDDSLQQVGQYIGVFSASSVQQSSFMVIL